MIEDKIIEGRVSIGKTGLRFDVRTEMGYHMGFSYTKIPELRAIGISNITQDQQFVLFLDFDKIKKDDLYKHLYYMAKENGLSHFFILSTSESNFHAVCMEKFRLSELQPIINNSLCDCSYKAIALKVDKGWILRISEKKDLDGNVIKDKPAYVDFIQYSYPQRKLSRAHLELFAKLYPEVAYHYKNGAEFHSSNLDDFSNIKMVRYGTSSSSFMTDCGIGDLIDAKKLNIEWIEKVEGN